MIFQMVKPNNDGFPYQFPPDNSKEKTGFSPQGTGNEELDKAIALAGYAYDPNQDIFYSVMDPWQRNVGYCRLYDEAAAPWGMIIDCEPIYFEYGEKKWMIAFWKGQYDLVTGGEIGIYAEAFELSIPGLFSGTFYKAATDAECLQMSYTLKRDGVTLFSREGRHWWLTGFKLGEFSEPSDLTMDVSITFDDNLMCTAFLNAFREVGYSDNEFSVNGNTVSFIFATPLSPQPFTRTAATDWIIQRKNELLCKKYQEITGEQLTFPEKLKAIEEQAPDIYQKVMKLGKNQLLFDKYQEITGVSQDFQDKVRINEEQSLEGYQENNKLEKNHPLYDKYEKFTGMPQNYHAKVNSIEFEDPDLNKTISKKTKKESSETWVVSIVFGLFIIFWLVQGKTNTRELINLKNMILQQLKKNSKKK